MTAIVEVVTKTKMGQGPVLLAWTGGTVGRVTKLGKIDMSKKLLKVKGGNPARIVAIFEEELGEGTVTVEVDEVADWDAATVGGEQSSCTIGQVLPKATAKKWQYAATTVHVNVMSFEADPHSGLAKATLEITPIAADATTVPWTFDNDAANS